MLDVPFTSLMRMTMHVQTANFSIASLSSRDTAWNPQIYVNTVGNLCDYLIKGLRGLVTRPEANLTLAACICKLYSIQFCHSEFAHTVYTSISYLIDFSPLTTAKILQFLFYITWQK